MDIDENRILALSLFNDSIRKHIIGDLKVLDTIQPKENSNACAVPTAMLILGALEFIGFLIKDQGKLGNSEVNISEAIRYGNYFPTTYSDANIEDLTRAYRHGLMHSFFPQQRSNKAFGIHKSNNTELFETFNIDGGSVTSLNVNVLSDDFKCYVDNLCNEIETTQDAKLLANMAHSFKLFYSNSLLATSSTTTQTTVAPGITWQK